MSDNDWMHALGILRSQGLTYDEIGTEIGASSRSVRRWDLHRLRVELGAEAPLPGRQEARPLGIYALALHDAATRPKEPIPLD